MSQPLDVMTTTPKSRIRVCLAKQKPQVWDKLPTPPPPPQKKKEEKEDNERNKLVLLDRVVAIQHNGHIRFFLAFYYGRKFHIK